jgi:hypothetical protein
MSQFAKLPSGTIIDLDRLVCVEPYSGSGPPWVVRLKELNLTISLEDFEALWRTMEQRHLLFVAGQDGA